MSAQPYSLGFADLSSVEPPPTDPASLNPDITPAASPVLSGIPKAPAKEAPLIDASKNPLGAIGAVLMNVSRGMRGQPLYTEQLREQRQQQDMMEMKKTEVGIDAMSKGLAMIQTVPDAQREQAAQQYGKLFEHVLPGFTASLVDASKRPAATEAQLSALGEHAQTLISLTGSLQGALKLAQKKEFMDTLNASSDARNTPEIAGAFKRMQKTLTETPGGSAILEKAAQDGWTLSDLQDPAVREAMGLTQSQVNTIARNPDVQNTLRPMGFIPTADVEAKAKAKIKADANLKPLDRLRQEAEISAQATAGATRVNYQDGDGNIRVGTMGERDKMAAAGFQPIVTGRTQQDVEAGASARAKGKYEGEMGLPVDPFVAAITGTAPSTTRQEFVDRGGNPNLDATTVRELQSTEAGFKGARDAVGTLRTIVQQNPNANTRVAGFQRVATNLLSELRSFNQATGIETPDLAKEAGKYEKVFRENGIDNALAQQAVVTLAYMQSSQFGQSGHSASDRDIREAAKAVGGSNADPAILTRMLDQAESNFDSTYRNKVETVTRIRPPSNLPDVQKAETVAQQLADGALSAQDYAQALKDMSPRAKLTLQSLISSQRVKPSKKGP